MHLMVWCFAETQSNLALWTGMIHQATVAAVVHMEVSTCADNNYHTGFDQSANG